MQPDRIDVTELPESQLKKSKTWRENVDQFGRCSRCGEMASLLDPCCGAGLHFEGGNSHYEDLWSDIEFELQEIAEADYESREE